jgi:sialate O-acetylesterase
MPMTISGLNTIEIKNVLVGEVWLCSGQSNMQMTMAKTESCKYGGVMNSEQEIAAANYPNIRLFTVEQKTTEQPQSDCKGQWQQCSPQTVTEFSATAYFFGRQLHNELNVPIGLINTSWGATPIEAWMSREVLKSGADFEPIFKRYADAAAKYPQAKKEYDQKIKEWEEAVAKTKIENKALPEKPLPPVGPGHKSSPAGLYNAMVSPLIPYAIKGVIWYQGEANRSRAYQYRKLFTVMIKSWRDKWGQGDFPFYYVQIAPYKYLKEAATVAAELREAQLMTLSIPNTGMVVTTDIGDANDIHPKNKQEAGRRLALWALAKTYGKNKAYCGPIYKSMKLDDNKIILQFDYAENGLVFKGSTLKGFTIAAADKKFVSAEAEIAGNTISVSSKEIANPVAVRYGWENNPVCNLYNKEGLPASPFRTDRWSGVTINEK